MIGCTLTVTSVERSSGWRFCTHQGCPVNAWSKERNAFVCSCHASIFDPRNGAQVLDGPAPRPLAALGLKLKDGVVTVASTFSGRLGGEQG